MNQKDPNPDPVDDDLLNDNGDFEMEADAGTINEDELIENEVEIVETKIEDFDFDFDEDFDDDFEDELEQDDQDDDAWDVMKGPPPTSPKK